MYIPQSEPSFEVFFPWASTNHQSRITMMNKWVHRRVKNGSWIVMFSPLNCKVGVWL